VSGCRGEEVQQGGVSKCCQKLGPVQCEIKKCSNDACSSTNSCQKWMRVRQTRCREERSKCEATRTSGKGGSTKQR
jgi:hypothetical protein